MLEKTKTLPFRIFRIAVLIMATVLLLTVTHPARMPVLLLMVPFAAMFVCLYLAVLEVIRFFQPGDEEGSTKRPIYRPRLLAAVIAGFPVLLLVLQSVMRLNHWDILITLGIFLLAYVFVSRGTFLAGK